MLSPSQVVSENIGSPQSDRLTDTRGKSDRIRSLAEIVFENGRSVCAKIAYVVLSLSLVFFIGDFLIAVVRRCCLKQKMCTKFIRDKKLFEIKMRKFQKELDGLCVPVKTLENSKNQLDGLRNFLTEGSEEQRRIDLLIKRYDYEIEMKKYPDLFSCDFWHFMCHLRDPKLTLEALKDKEVMLYKLRDSLTNKFERELVNDLIASYKVKFSELNDAKKAVDQPQPQPQPQQTEQGNIYESRIKLLRSSLSDSEQTTETLTATVIELAKIRDSRCDNEQRDRAMSLIASCWVKFSKLNDAKKADADCKRRL